ncbi:MAG TPA: hypothetical protein VGO62_05640, partial [Myxococcota bacterium]
MKTALMTLGLVAALGGCDAHEHLAKNDSTLPHETDNYAATHMSHAQRVADAEREAAAETHAAADPRAQKDAIVDALYARYGGSDLAQNTRGEAATGASGSDVEHNPPDIEDRAKAVGQDVREGVASSVARADRAAFEQRCMTVGRGDEPIWAGDDRARNFFAQSDVKDKCTEVV